MTKYELNSELFPYFLVRIYRTIRDESLKEKNSRIRPQKFAELQHFKLWQDYLKSLEINGKDELVKKHSKLGFLDKFLDNKNFLLFPVLPKEELSDEDFKIKYKGCERLEHGTFIKQNSDLAINFKNFIYDICIKLFPEYGDDWTKIKTYSGLISRPIQNPYQSVEQYREEVGIVDNEPEIFSQCIELVSDTILNALPLNFDDKYMFIPKDGAPGEVNVVEVNGTCYAAELLKNKEDRYGQFKVKAVEYFIDNYDDIMTLVRQGNLTKLFEKHHILFYSRFAPRLQSEKHGKERKAMLGDVFFSGEVKIKTIDYSIKRSDIHNIAELENDTINDILNNYWKTRGRGMCPAIFKSLCLCILYMRMIYFELAERWAFTFKTGDNDYMTSKIKDYGAKKTITFDAMSFDRTPKIEYNAAIYNSLAKKNRDMALLLAIQAISPIALGRIVCEDGVIDNICLGDPLDPNTFNFYQKTSGDPDVTLIGKIMCITKVIKCASEVLGRKFNDAFITEFLEGKLDIAALSLGDNILLLFRNTSYVDSMIELMETADTIKFNVEEDNLFGGKRYEIREDGSVIVSISALSFVDKFVNPELDYSEGNHDGWSLGFEARIAEATEQASRTGDDRLLQLLSEIDNWLEKHSFVSLQEMINKYKPIFEKELKYFEELRKAMLINQDRRLREVVSDISKLKYKYDIETFDSYTANLLRKYVSNELEDAYKRKLKSILRYNIKE